MIENLIHFESVFKIKISSYDNLAEFINTLNNNLFFVDTKDYTVEIYEAQDKSIYNHLQYYQDLKKYADKIESKSWTIINKKELQKYSLSINETNVEYVFNYIKSIEEWPDYFTRPINLFINCYLSFVDNDNREINESIELAGLHRNVIILTISKDNTASIFYTKRFNSEDIDSQKKIIKEVFKTKKEFNFIEYKLQKGIYIKKRGSI